MPGWAIADINVGILYLFAISSLGVYGIIMAGWASNSRYAFLGALRSAAQMVSYEVSIGFVLVTVLLCAGSLNLTDIVVAQRHIWFAHPAVADVHHLLHLGAGRDQPRAVRPARRRDAKSSPAISSNIARWPSRCSSSANTRNMILMSAMTTILFLGGWLRAVRHRAVHLDSRADLVRPEDLLLLFVFLWVRATFPRFRYDQLMRLGWKVFLPFSLLWLVLTAGVLIAFGWLPNALTGPR